jgi:hypothetical protein
MKKTGAILFLLIYLIANTELHQFLRMPVLFEHYNEHQQDNPAISLVDFLVLHYFNGDKRDGDYARDQQLPFKSDTCPEISFSIAMPPDDFPETTVQVFNLTQARVMFKSSFTISSFHFSIWQPPRA